MSPLEAVRAGGRLEGFFCSPIKAVREFLQYYTILVSVWEASYIDTCYAGFVIHEYFGTR